MFVEVLFNLKKKKKKVRMSKTNHLISNTSMNLKIVVLPAQLRLLATVCGGAKTSET